MNPGDTPAPNDPPAPDTDHRPAPAPAEPTFQGGASRGLLALLLLASFVFTVWPIVATPWFFSNDGPEHLYSAWIWLHPEQLSTVEQAYVAVHWPATAAFATAVLAPLLTGLPWATAWTSFLVLSALLMNAGLSAILMRSPPRNWPLLLAVPPLTTGWLFLMGFHNFYGGLALGLLLVAACMRWRCWTWPQTAGILIALTGIAVCHTLSAAITGLLLACCVLMQTGLSAHERGHAWLRLAAVGVPTLAFVLSVGADYETSATLARDAGVRWIVREHPIEFFQTATPGPAWLTLPLPLLALAGWLVSTPKVLSSFATPRDSTTSQPPSEPDIALTRALWLVALVCSLVWTLFPFSTSSWQMISPRFAPVAIVAGLCLLPLRSRLAQWVCVAAFAALSSGWTLWLTDFQRDMNEGCRDMTTALHSADDQQGYQGWLSFRSCTQPTGFQEDKAIPWAHFTKHMPAAFATAGRSLHQGFHGKPSIHTHTLFTAWDLMPGRRPDPNYLGLQLMGMRAAGYSLEQMRPVLLDIHERAATWDHTWIFGADDIFSAAFPAHDFQVQQTTGDLTLVTFIGCPLRVTVPPVASPVRVEHGWAQRPFDAPFQRVAVAPFTPVVELARTTCGPIWVRLYDDTTGNPMACPGASDPALAQTLPPGTPRDLRCL